MKHVLNILIDLIIVLGSILVSFKLLVGLGILKAYPVNIEAFYTIVPWIITMYLIFMYVFGLYSSERYSLGEVIYTVFLITVSLTLGIMATCFFIREASFAYPRSVIFLSAVLYFILLSLWRGMLGWRARKSHGTRSVVVVGNREATHLSNVLKSHYSNLYQIKKTCNEKDLALFFELNEASEIFISSEVTDHMRERIFIYAVEHEKPVYFIPKFSDIEVMNARLYKTDDIATYRINPLSLSAEEIFLKRVFDLFFAGLASLVALPVGLVVAGLVKLDGGPVFYSQERCTRGKKHFRILKFRTMIPNAEKFSGPVLAGVHDSRITKIGRFIRATRLDELPQLLNILSGEMSIVGPRPERQFFIDRFEAELPTYSHRLKVKAGLTGLAQVEGKYNTSVEDKLRYDLIYITNYSLARDFLICLQTIKILFMKKSTEGVAQPVAERIAEI